MSDTDTEFNDALNTLHEYFGEPENRARIERAVSAGIDAAESAMRSDTRWRVPRHRDLRRNRFKRYLAPYREQLITSMAQEMTREFPHVLSRENAQMVAQVAISQVEPELQERYGRILEQQVRLAVSGIALPWVSDNLGDLCQLFLPLRDEKAKVWRLPISLNASEPPRTYLVVSDEGEVVSDPQSILRELKPG